MNSSLNAGTPLGEEFVDITRHKRNHGPFVSEQLPRLVPAYGPVPAEGCSIRGRAT